MGDEEVTKRRASVLARPGYRRLWAARTVSQWGDVVQFIIVALLALRLTDSGVGFSDAVLAEVVPLIGLALLACAQQAWAPFTRETRSGVASFPPSISSGTAPGS